MLKSLKVRFLGKWDQKMRLKMLCARARGCACLQEIRGTNRCPEERRPKRGGESLGFVLHRDLAGRLALYHACGWVGG